MTNEKGKTKWEKARMNCCDIFWVAFLNQIVIFGLRYRTVPYGNCDDDEWWHGCGCMKKNRYELKFRKAWRAYVRLFSQKSVIQNRRTHGTVRTYDNYLPHMNHIFLSKKVITTVCVVQYRSIKKSSDLKKLIIFWKISIASDVWNRYKF